MLCFIVYFFFFSSRRRHTRCGRDWSSDVCSSDLEAERGLAYVGLGDLFDRVPDDVIAELSPPRRRALEIALLRDETVDDGADHRALGVAVRDVLHLLGEREPVVVAIDDA